MKRVSFIFFLVLCLIASFPLSSFAANTYYRYHFRDPSLDGNFVYANTAGCRVFYPVVYNTGSVSGTITDSGTSHTFTANIDDSKLSALLIYNGSNSCSIIFTSVYSVSINIAMVYYDFNGDVKSTVTFSVPSNSYYTYTFTDNYIDSGVYTGNIVRDSSFSSIDQGLITFADDLDYTGQIASINDLLNSLVTSCNTIISQDSAYYDIVSAFVDDFFYHSNGDGEPGNVRWRWNNYCYLVNNFSSNMFNFARDFNSWYNDYYIPKTDMTNLLLQDILNALNYNDDPQITSPEQTELASNVDIYESQEANLIDSQGEELESLGSVIGSWSDSVSTAGRAFQFIHWFFDNFIHDFYLPYLLIPLIFGLIVLILGRRLQT